MLLFNLMCKFLEKKYLFCIKYCYWLTSINQMDKKLENAYVYFTFFYFISIFYLQYIINFYSGLFFSKQSFINTVFKFGK